MPEVIRDSKRRAITAALVYAIAGALWITYSDQLVAMWADNPEHLSLLQTYKGWFFVAVTAVIVGLVLHRLFRADVRHAEALRCRERELATLMANLPGMAYRGVFDRHWTMNFVSDSCFALTGYRPEAIIDNRDIAFGDLIHPEDIGQMTRVVAEAVARDEPFAVEYRIRQRGGGTIWVWEQGRQVHYVGGDHLEGIILDITNRKQLEKRLGREATIDQLTGLANRRELERVFVEELERALRYQRPLALLWLDLDHFKRVNDTYGHMVGDAVLRSVSQLLRESKRNVDHIGRYGGEEFVLLMPEMGLDEAREAGERLRKLVATTPVGLASGESLYLTVSVGVAACPEHGTTRDELYRRVDAAMYRAKEDGRDRVAVAPLPGNEAIPDSAR